VRLLVRPERFELPTCCSGGLAALIINTLHGELPIASEHYQSLV